MPWVRSHVSASRIEVTAVTKPVTHDLGIYGAHLHVATTRKQMTTLRRRYDLAKPESIGATYLTVDTHANNTIHLTVWLDRDNLDGAALVDTIAHEAVHAAAQLLDHIGQQADRHDSEVMAYLTGYIAARTWEAAA